MRDGTSHHGGVCRRPPEAASAPDPWAGQSLGRGRASSPPGSRESGRGRRMALPIPGEPWLEPILWSERALQRGREAGGRGLRRANAVRVFPPL